MMCIISCVSSILSFPEALPNSLPFYFTLPLSRFLVRVISHERVHRGGAFARFLYRKENLAARSHRLRRGNPSSTVVPVTACP